MTPHPSLAVRWVWWVLLTGTVTVAASYVVISMLGDSLLAARIAQWMFLLLVFDAAIGILYGVISRTRRAASRAAARASGAELSALLLGKRPPTLPDHSVDNYSAYPPERSDAGDDTPSGTRSGP